MAIEEGGRDRLEALVQMLPGVPRLADVQAESRGDVIEIRRGAARVLLAACSIVGSQPDVLHDAFSDGAGLLLLGPAPSGLMQKLESVGAVALLEDWGSHEAVFLAVDGLLERVQLRADMAAGTKLVSRYEYELNELVEIARALTQERDLDVLLNLVLEKSRYITGADAGSIYVLEGESQEVGQQRLHFKLSQNDSVDFQSREFVMPVSNRSIAGTAAIERKAINIADVYRLGPEGSYDFEAEFVHDSSFDKKFGYQTRSMLAVPLISAEDAVIGVIQLINKKRHPERKLETVEDFDNEVVAFDRRSEELLATLAAQAGIALENALLYEEIQSIFEGFVRASVQAIEQRDPTTSGHSLRVSALCNQLAMEVDREQTGPYRDVSFDKLALRELRYAALLHDFGKIGVREEVLVKEKKLHPHQREVIRLRTELAHRAAEVETLRKKIELIQTRASPSDLAALDMSLVERRDELERAWEKVMAANEPSISEAESLARISEVATITFDGAAGEREPLLEPDQVAALRIKRGSLSPEELEEIRAHVVHTYNFLAKIPWGKSMARIPQIAGAHHERLDGSGYPNGIGPDEISVQSRIIAVADVYDGLTASDRPYKKAVSVERALGILQNQAETGYLDGELVRIFRAAEVYSAVGDETEG